MRANAAASYGLRGQADPVQVQEAEPADTAVQEAKLKTEVGTTAPWPNVAVICVQSVGDHVGDDRHSSTHLGRFGPFQVQINRPASIVPSRKRSSRGRTKANSAAVEPLSPGRRAREREGIILPSPGFGIQL